MSVVPCRIADTRNANGPFGGPAIAGGSTRDFAVTASACAIPANAVSYSLNVTVAPSGPLGFVTVWPSGQTQPTVSTLNSLDGRIKANAAIVPAGSGGAISVFAIDPTNVIIDINGYFVPVTVAQGLAFYPVTPCRLADTRNATGTFGGPSMIAAATRDFPVQSGSCGIPATAQAYVVNMTVVPNGVLGFLTAWPAGSQRPLASTLNALTGAITSNLSIVPAGTGGAISVYVTDRTDLIMDITGYFAPPGGGSLDFYSVSPCRVLDTRGGAAPLGGPAMSGGSTASFPRTLFVMQYSGGGAGLFHECDRGAAGASRIPHSLGKRNHATGIDFEFAGREYCGERCPGAGWRQRRCHSLHDGLESTDSRYQRLFQIATSFWGRALRQFDKLNRRPQHLRARAPQIGPPLKLIAGSDTIMTSNGEPGGTGECLPP